MPKRCSLSTHVANQGNGVLVGVPVPLLGVIRIMHNQNRVIVAIDLGSSSIRASAFSLVEADNDLNVVEAISGTSTSRPLALVEPNTGRIKLYLERDKKDETVFDAIDQCVDETLVKLRARLGRLAFEVVGVSFSNFVMNLLGVDEEGTVIGPEASISYACNSPDIAEEVATIRKCVHCMVPLYNKLPFPFILTLCLFPFKKTNR